MTIIAKQFGFTTGAGVIDNLVDGDYGVGWTPLSTDFAAYSAQFFLDDRTTLNTGASFPALEFDLGSAKRVPQIFLKCHSLLTLGPAILIGSDNPATSPANTLQSGDVLLAQYTQAQIVSNKFLDVQAMKDADIRKRFLRLLQRSSAPAAVAPTPGPTNSTTYDAATGFFEVPFYATKLIAEAWGGGASGGVASQANNGGATWIRWNDSTGIMTANGGTKNSATVANAHGAGTGGTATGGNIANTTGGAASAPSPATSGGGITGKGGDAPNGGLGGAGIITAYTGGMLPGVPPMLISGNPGQTPGGGGGGRQTWYPAGDVIMQKWPAGGSGGYCRQEFLIGEAYGQPGDILSYSVGAGGVSAAPDGRGGEGRVRFTIV